MADTKNGKLVRAVGLWGLVAMCINAIIGSGVFLLPSESYRLLGPFSLWAPLIFALPVFILALCFAEAASHFSEPGGAYLYSRAAFGDFIGFETGWMNWLARVTSLASLSNGFVVSLARFYPPLGAGVLRWSLIIGSLLILGILHFFGVIYVLAQHGAMSALTNLGDSKTPIADAAAALVGTWGAVIITLGAVLSMAGTNSGTVLEGSRMLYALSLDRKMGPISYVHPRF